MIYSCFLRHGLAGTVLLFLLCATVRSQDLSPGLQVSPSDYDRYVASQAQNVKRHAWPANTPAARSMREGAPRASDTALDVAGHARRLVGVKRDVGSQVNQELTHKGRQARPQGH